MPPSPGADFERLLAGLTRELTARGVPFMLIGGQAVLLHGAPRLTEDVDLTLGVGPDQLDLVLASCGALGLQPLPVDIRDFVRDTFVLPARDPGTGIRVDFIFSSTEYERQAIGRAVRVPLGGESVPFATAEDLLIHKLFAGRPRDLEDAVGVVRRCRGRLNWGYVEHWLPGFADLPGQEDLMARLRWVRDEAK